MDNHLFETFSDMTAADWAEQVALDLKGKSPDDIKTLLTMEGFKISPYFTEKPSINVPDTSGKGWKIRAIGSEMNTDQLTAALSEGSSIGYNEIVLDPEHLENFNKKEKTHPELGLHINLSGYNDKTLQDSLNFLSQGSLSKNQHSLSYDPIAAALKTGNWEIDASGDMTKFSAFFMAVHKSNPELKQLVVNGQLYGRAGGSAIQELACIISHLNEYLHQLKSDDLLDKFHVTNLEIRISIGGNYFVEIAKCRALKLLIDQLLETYDIRANDDWNLVGENNIMTFSTKDIDTNILRSTTAAMSAILGGCQSIMLHAHDGINNVFGQRIARNIQFILQHEAHLDKVKDPTAGSFYLENLTKELALKGWGKFQEIEAAGGLIAEFEKGIVQKEIEQAAELRCQRVKGHSDILIGMNKYQPKQNNIGYKHEAVDTGNSTFRPLRPLYLEDSV